MKLLLSNITTESVVIAITGYLIVFAALVLLFWFFSMVPRIIRIKRIRQGRKHGKGSLHGEGISGEETAAIALALHLCNEEQHDTESGVLTIKKISKAYSPWSSKIYAVRNQFNRQ